jgi:hypothetical protein
MRCLFLLLLPLFACDPAGPTYTIVCNHVFQYDCSRLDMNCKRSYDFHSCSLRKQSATHWGAICPEISLMDINWFDRQDCTLFEESHVDDPKSVIKGGK